MGFKSLTIILLLLPCYLAFASPAQHTVNPVAVKGTIDLRKQSLSKEVHLNGEWLFFWEQLLNPRDTTKKKGILVNFPFKWNGYVLNGKELPSFGYATYRLTVLLPETAEPLSLKVPDVYCAYTLFINDSLMASNGKVSSDKKGFIPYWENRIIDIPPGTDTLLITLQVANFVHSKGGVSSPFEIGEEAVVKLNDQRSDGINLLLTGCLLMGGFFFLGLYLLGNRDKAILLFSLYSIVYSYRIIGTDTYVLHTLLPNISWYITIRLEYLSLFAGIGLFAMFTRSLYPEDVHKVIVNFITYVCFAFAAASLVLTPMYFTRLINPFLVLMIFCLLYLPYVYTRAYRHKRPGSAYSLLSSLALVLVFAISLLHYWEIISALRLLSFAGYIGFFFLQSLVLSNRVSFVLKKARVEAEQGLITKSEFLSTMSHEIRTPLNSVIGISHLLLKSNPRNDQAEQLEAMLFSANNLLAIVNDILDYSKIEAGKISFEHIEMDLEAIIKNIIKGLYGAAHDKGIDLKMYFDPSIHHKLLGDPTRTFQVISNLVHNAVKFTSTGYVEVAARVISQTESSVTLNIQVKDTGIGISKEKQNVIFDRFTQADSSTSRGFGGTGLGLSICKKLLELQNSSLELISEEGEGSTFYFIQTFEKSTLITGQQQETDALPEGDEKPFTGINILLVEDNPMNVVVAQAFLQRWGAHVDVATNGLEALDKIEPHRHRLVLIDIQMPVMDGYEASRRMRDNGITLPVIALTANLPKEIEEKIKNAGIDDILMKPFLPDELYRKVLYHLSKSKKGDET